MSKNGICLTDIGIRIMRISENAKAQTLKACALYIEEKLEKVVCLSSGSVFPI